MPIRKLPTLLVNQIAAGEVIERPGSVVKELIENSLDGGATRIDIAVEDGGRQRVRVSDNGGGIPEHELRLAVEPHATSKLETSEQLASIGTLGFRGEALASIASVSRLRVTSRAMIDGRAADSGWQIEADGDRISEPAPAPCAPGTIVEVRDLFFNTPARRKFMRAAGTEFGHISETVTRLAMVHHHVAFTLTHNGRQSINVAMEPSRRQRCIELLGVELDEAMLEFDQAEPPAAGGGKPAALWGLAGLPSIARATAKFQYVYVNGRPIRDRNLSHAIKEAYRGLIPPDKQPVVVLFIETDPTAVDVNVHPTKAEVRFREPSRFHGLVLAALRQRLLGSDLTPSVDVRSSMFGVRSAKLEPGEPTDRRSNIADPQDFVDYFKRMDPKQKGFIYQQVKEQLAREQPKIVTTDVTNDTPADRSSVTPPPIRSCQVLQVHKSYVITEDEDGILIVDQHALHERVMFEQLRERVLGQSRDMESQRLLMPVVVQVSPARLTALQTLGPLLKRIGVEAEPIGPDAIGIQAFPSFLFEREVDPGPFMADLLDKAQEGQFDFSNPNAEEAALHEVLDMMACKAAVKAGDRMSDAELAALLAKRDQIERSSNCPHGRPTTIRLTLRDLEKQFKRT